MIKYVTQPHAEGEFKDKLSLELLIKDTIPNIYKDDNCVTVVWDDLINFIFSLPFLGELSETKLSLEVEKEEVEELYRSLDDMRAQRDRAEEDARGWMSSYQDIVKEAELGSHFRELMKRYNIILKDENEGGGERDE